MIKLIRSFSIFYKMVIIVIGIFGLYLATGLPEGVFKQTTFLYYTNLSNALCVVYLCILLIIEGFNKDALSSRFIGAFKRFKGAVTCAITITMLVYWILLHNTGMETMQSILLHLIIPVMMIIDWIVFDKKGTYRKKDPIIWLVIPGIYFVFALFIAQTGVTFYNGSRFAYFFLDYDVLGWFGVARYFFVLLLSFLLLGYVFYFLDHYMNRFLG